MDIRKIKISEINPAPYNPRKDLKPGDPEYQRIEASIEGFGLVEPLVWNCRTKNLVGGHQRLKVLIQRGLNEVEVSVVDIDLEQEKLLCVSLNKVSGAWDMDKLAMLLEELSKTPSFDVGLTGFDAPEISEILDRYSEGKEDDFNVDAVVESIVEPVTKKGDLIELGPHKVLCGDSSNIDDLRLLIGEERANLVHTDPPYNVAYMGGARPNPEARPKKSREWERIYHDNMPQDEYEAWLKKIFTNMTAFLAPGAPAYIWNGHKNFGPMHDMLCELNFHVASVIVWAKPNFAISYSDYHEQVEFCLYSWKKDGGGHKWYGPVNESSLWEVKRDVTRDYVHPTQKPIALAQRAIRNSSVRGDLVLDLFLGSGSTLIGAESLERRCYGIELDPKYVDAIVRRYIAYKGANKVSKEVRDKYLVEATHG